MNYQPLLMVRSWNNYVRCMSFYILMNLWYGRIASWDIVSLWYLPRIGPSVTDMQHYYHARYPTNDWHLACIFSSVYFSVEVCLEGVFPHSVSTRRIFLRQGLCPPPPSRWLPPPPHAGSPPPPPHAGSPPPTTTTTTPSRQKKKIEQRGPSSPPPLKPSEGAIELTHGSACIIGW